ncbi:hypothetical protein C8J57DRAFT_1517121 [Mycena rebaudengoi]|nr:hypothetical protein C8J57DRAFT_1517121 [Mycena rebaudengoi]
MMVARVFCRIRTPAYCILFGIVAPLHITYPNPARHHDVLGLAQPPKATPISGPPARPPPRGLVFVYNYIDLLPWHTALPPLLLVLVGRSAQGLPRRCASRARHLLRVCPAFGVALPLPIDAAGMELVWAGEVRVSITGLVRLGTAPVLVRAHPAPSSLEGADL